MAKASNNAQKSNPGSSKKEPANAPGVKVVIEIRFPQLENQPSAFSTFAYAEKNVTDQGLAPVTAILQITPVKKIHIVEVDVNAETIVKDSDVEAEAVFEKSGEVSARKPISFYLHIVGEANTRMDIKLQFNGQEVFNNPVYIPNTGRLVEQKILL